MVEQIGEQEILKPEKNIALRWSIKHLEPFFQLWFFLGGKFCRWPHVQDDSLKKSLFLYFVTYIAGGE